MLGTLTCALTKNYMDYMPYHSHMAILQFATQWGERCSRTAASFYRFHLCVERRFLCGVAL